MRKKENYATMVGFLQQTKKNYRFEDRVRRRRKLAAPGLICRKLQKYLKILRDSLEKRLV